MPSNPLFRTKQVKIDTLGEYLQQIRKQLNLDLKTVSILTQIKPSYIDQLESGAYQKLPADVYIRGFLKSLADFYRVKEKILIDQYEKERGGFDTHQAVQKKFEKIGWVSFTPKTLIGTVSLLVAILAVVYVALEIRSVLASPFLSLNEPAENITIDGNSVVISGTGEIGAEIFINNQPVLADQNGQFTETLFLSPGLNVIEVTEKNKFNKVSKITRHITSSAIVDQPSPPLAVNLTIEIGPNSAWVNLEADGVLVHRGTMLPGFIKTISAKNEIILTSANAGSTKIIYNGKDLGLMGREGEVIRNVGFSTQQQ